MSHRIAFISEYCDRWCERCPFTDRCSAFALQAALTMCDGDFKEAMALAVCRPAVPGDTKPRVSHDGPDGDPTPEELEAFGKELDARERRMNETPAMTVAAAVTTLAFEWLRANEARLLASQPRPIADAIQVMAWDAALIGAKVNRALQGRDAAVHAEVFRRDRVQNDWNGSAKVALISIRRSIAAWRTVADATGDSAAGGIATALETLHGEIERVFPDAWLFQRPGFDA